ncbi:MAG: chromosomal replication initiator protein DnaA [Endomicrobiia bacterium]
MINFWELKFSPAENYSNRYRLKIKCSSEDVEEISNFLKNEMHLDISPAFHSLNGEYDWGIYIYDLKSETKNKLIEKMFFICKNGIVEDKEKIQNDTKSGNNTEIPPELGNILSDLVKNMSEKAVTSSSQTVSKAQTVDQEYYGLPINPKYTFDNFVVGANNRFTHAAALAVAENPGKTYNPLFIYGGVGLGKTHLMQAIGHSIKSKKPLSKIIYITSEKFVSQVIEAIRTGDIRNLRDSYRDIDILLVDDIQFMSESESTQEEFFHIFNTLHQYGRQIVMTSDRPPKLLTTLEDRLRSRFEWGLIADIKSPSLETRVAILKRKGEEENVNLDDNILLYIASKLKSNIRELEGFLKRINAYASLTNQTVDINLVKQLMSELLPEEELTDEEKKLLENHEEVIKEKSVISHPTVPLHPKPKIQTFNSVGTQQTSGFKSVKAKPVSIENIYKASHTDKETQEVKEHKPVVEQPGLHQPQDQGPKTQPKIDEESFYREYESAVNTVEVAFFFPEGKTEELYSVKQKFAETIKKHNLRYKIITAFDRPYELENINYKMFVELCKTNKIDVCVLISPPPGTNISAEEFYENILPVMESGQIIFEFIPWRDLTKEYRYLNLALDIALSKFKLE